MAMRVLRISLATLTLLVALPASRFALAAEDPKVTAAKTDVSTLATAVDAYEIDTGTFPTAAQGLKALLVKPDGVANWHGPYIKSLQKDPWDKPYVYRVPGNGKRPYDLFSTGPDGQEGGGDDIRFGR